MNFQELELIVVLLGGYAVLSAGAFFFVLPFSNSFIYRKSLLVASLIPVLMGFLIFAFSYLMFSGQTVMKLAPFGISLSLFIYVLIRIWNANLPAGTKTIHIVVVVLLILCDIWSGVIAWFAMDNCFMGACA